MRSCSWVSSYIDPVSILVFKWCPHAFTSPLTYPLPPTSPCPCMLAHQHQYLNTLILKGKNNYKRVSVQKIMFSTILLTFLLTSGRIPGRSALPKSTLFSKGAPLLFTSPNIPLTYPLPILTYPYLPITSPIYVCTSTSIPEHADVMGGKDVDGENVVKVEAFDEEPVEHRRASVLEQDVKTLAQIRLKKKKKMFFFLKSITNKAEKEEEIRFNLNLF